MELSPALLHVHQSEDPSSAFHGMAQALSASLPLRCAAYVRSDDRVIRDCWPDPARLTDDLLDAALHIPRPEVLPLGSEFPFDAAAFPDSEMLVLPVRAGEQRRGACVLIAAVGSYGEDLQPWDQLVRAIEQSETRHERLARAEQRASELQRRVEESESLHILGLAANRTLDMREVLSLVARLTRTLLGAQYVTVNTADAGMIYTVASLGLRNAEAALDDYHLARTVVEAEKPLIIGGPEANLQVENFPFHVAEGMRAGVGIPLTLFGETFGALLVGYRREYEVSPRDIRLALALAGHAAVAISNARLHATVEERSQELERAYRKLDALTHAKERFFASINHELRNPVGAILGYLGLLLDGNGGEIPPAGRRYVEKANRAALTLRTLVNDILDLSKLAAGKLEVDLQPCTVADLLDAVLNTIQPLADERAVLIRVDVPADLPILCTDADRAQQILVNLLSNAVKFTGDARVSVGAAAVEVDAGGEEPTSAVEIRVTDSGPGIPPEDVQRIFEEYEQVKGTKGGTGLGLPIARRLARALGGELTVESRVGEGSTFSLRLPVTPRTVSLEVVTQPSEAQIVDPY